jgi:hypothetical protein
VTGRCGRFSQAHAVLVFGCPSRTGSMAIDAVDVDDEQPGPGIEV